MNVSLPEILPLVSHDVEAISLLADTIWRHHYATIISSAQIDYMLVQRYRPNLIQRQLADSDIWWRKLVLADRIIGFSCYMRDSKPETLKIDKFYIHCDHHRQGYGAIIVADAVKILRELDLHTLILTVNKHNHAAISAYRHYGFEITADSVVDIGGGFVMNDYLMTLTHWKRWDS